MSKEDTYSLRMRLRHLDEAAKVLATASPSVAAFLNNQLDRGSKALPAYNPKPSRAREVCTACGNPMTPGQSCTVSLQTQRVQKSKSAKDNKKRRGGHETQRDSHQSLARHTVYECHRCYRRTKLPGHRHGEGLLKQQDATPKPEKEILEPPGPSDNLPTTASSQNASSTANANSRKRARARKKGGLQGMLEKSKSQSTSSLGSGFGLDLMDLMKSD